MKDHKAALQLSSNQREKILWNHIVKDTSEFGDLDDETYCQICFKSIDELEDWVLVFPFNPNNTYKKGEQKLILC